MMLVTNRVHFTLRLEAETHQKITSIAEADKRSLNAQIEFALLAFIRDYEKEHGPIVLDPEE